MSKKNRSKKRDQPESAPTSSRRAAAAAHVEAERRRARRRTVLVQAIIGLALLVLVIGVTVALLSSRDDPTVSADGTPSSVNEDGAFVTGPKDADVVVQVVEDFQCPVCKQFESVSGDLLSQLRESGVQVQYRGVSFLDRMSSTQYSTRALNASACVMPEGEETWQKFHDTLFANQPPEGGTGLPDDQLVQLASAAGASGDDVASCIKDQPYADWTAATTKAATDDGVDGTPTIFVNGKKLGSFDPAAIQKAVEAAGQAQ